MMLIKVKRKMMLRLGRVIKKSNLMARKMNIMMKEKKKKN